MCSSMDLSVLRVLQAVPLSEAHPAEDPLTVVTQTQAEHSAQTLRSEWSTLIGRAQSRHCPLIGWIRNVADAQSLIALLRHPKHFFLFLCLNGIKEQASATPWTQPIRAQYLDCSPPMGELLPQTWHSPGQS